MFSIISTKCSRETHLSFLRSHQLLVTLIFVAGSLVVAAVPVAADPCPPPGSNFIGGGVPPIQVSLSGNDTVGVNEPYTLSVTHSDTDDYWNLETGSCDDTTTIIGIYWTDGSLQLSPGNGPFTHVFKNKGEFTIVVAVDDDANTGNADDDPIIFAWKTITVTGPGGECADGPCQPCQMCDGKPCNLSAVWTTDPWGGPSGIRYTSHPYQEYSGLPFGTYSQGKNRGFGLIESGRATLFSTYDDYHSLTIRWADRETGFFEKVDGTYYEVNGTRTATASNGKISVYQNGVLLEKYSGSNSDYLIEAATDVYGKVTSFTYSQGHLSTMEVEDGITYTYTWNGNILERIDASDGYRMVFILDGNGNLWKIRRTDENNSAKIFEEIWFTHDTTNSHLIRSIANYRLVNDSLTLVFIQNIDYEDSDGRVVENEQYDGDESLVSANTWALTGYETGSKQSEWTDGSYQRLLIKNRGTTNREYVHEWRNSANTAVIYASSKLLNLTYNVITAATDITGATTAYRRDFQEGTGTEGTLVKIKDFYGNHLDYHYTEDKDIDELSLYQKGSSGDTLLSVMGFEYDDYHYLDRTFVYDEDTSQLLSEGREEYTTRGSLANITDGEGRKTNYKTENVGAVQRVGILDSTITMQFNEAGLLTRILSPSGLFMDYDYSPSGRLSQVTQYVNVSATPTPIITSITHDGSGYGKNITSIVDAEGHKWSYTYDGFTHLSEESMHDGTGSNPPVYASQFYEWNARGLLSKLTDFNGQVTEFEYDDAGRITRKNYMDGTNVAAYVEYIYTKGLLTSINSSDCESCGETERLLKYADKRKLVTAHTASTIGDVTFAYDGARRLKYMGYAKGWSSGANPTPTPFVREYTYDLANRVTGIKEKGASSNIADLEYNKADQLTHIGFANGAYGDWTYDGKAQVSEIVYRKSDDSVAASFRYAYNKDQLRTEVSREDGTATAYEYDDLLRLKKEDNINALKDSCVEFDGSNDYVGFTGSENPNLDGLSKLTVEAWVRTGSDVSTYQHFICKNGPVRMMINGSKFAATVNTHNNFWPWAVGNTTITTDTWYHVAVVYNKDAGSNQIKLFVNGSQDGTATATGTTWGTGQLIFGAAGESVPPSTGFFNGRLDEVRISNDALDVVQLWTYGVYASELVADGDTVGLWHFNEGDGAVVADYSTYGHNGSLGSGSAAPAWLFDENWSREYTYDNVGNRTERVRTDGGTSVTESLSYNGLGQLDEMTWTDSSVDYQNVYGYDDNGSLTSKQENSGSPYMQDARWGYAWSRDNRLSQVERWTGDTSSEVKDLEVDYNYCPACQGALTERVTKDGSGDVISWKRYEYEGLDLLRIDERYDDDSNGIDDTDPWRLQNMYVQRPGDVGDIVLDNSYYNGSLVTSMFYAYDAVGNMVGNFWSGTGYNKWDYDAFGHKLTGSWPSMDSNGPKEKLSGKLYDDDTGLYYFNARWYDPQTGRFISIDPRRLGITYATGETEGCLTCAGSRSADLDVENLLRIPNALNPYVFVLNNPVNLADPSGGCSGGGGCGGGGGNPPIPPTPSPTPTMGDFGRYAADLKAWKICESKFPDTTSQEFCDCYRTEREKAGIQ